MNKEESTGNMIWPHRSYSTQNFTKFLLWISNNECLAALLPHKEAACILKKYQEMEFPLQPAVV